MSSVNIDIFVNLRKQNLAPLVHCVIIASIHMCHACSTILILMFLYLFFQPFSYICIQVLTLCVVCFQCLLQHNFFTLMWSLKHVQTFFLCLCRRLNDSVTAFLKINNLFLLLKTSWHSYLLLCVIVLLSVYQQNKKF